MWKDQIISHRPLKVKEGSRRVSRRDATRITEEEREIQCMGGTPSTIANVQDGGRGHESRNTANYRS